MTHPRLSLALMAEPPAAQGRIVLFGATGETDLSDLPGPRLDVVSRFAPDVAQLSARGLQVLERPAPGLAYAGAVVFVPRSKLAARAMLAEAVACTAAGGRIWVDGAKAEGIDSILKALRETLGPDRPLEVIAKAHGKIAGFLAAPGLLPGWEAEALHPAPGFTTWPGVFCAESVDAGSALLAQALPARLPARMADLGAGWGWLSAQVLAREGVESLDLIEADGVALDCARRNLDDPRAQFIWGDATQWRPEARYSAIVMNPPFHVSRSADPGVGVAFIHAAARMLSISGRLWMVANRQLPYEEALEQAFQHHEEIGGDGRFKLIFAEKPRTGSAAGKGPVGKGPVGKGAARPKAGGRGAGPRHRR